jgi:cation:H+ antiporter
MFTGKKRKLDRWEAAIFILLYAGYVVYMIMQNE